MKKLLLLSALFIWFLKPVCSQPGLVDTSFSKKGIVRTDIGSAAGHSSLTRQVFAQPDGSIFIVFQSNDVTLTGKKRPDGSPDSTYGHFGFSVSVRMKNAYAAMQSDGKIVVAGTGIATTEANYGFGNTDFIVARYNTDGSLDNTFDSDGKVTTDFNDYIDAVSSVNIESNGKIVVSGYSSYPYDDNYDPDNPTGNISISRYNADGSLDKTFNTSGTLSSPAMSNNVYTAVQADGKIVAAVSSFYGLSMQRYNADGSLDSTFNSFSEIKKSGAAFIDRSVALQSDGKIILGGYWTLSDNSDFAVVRLKANGSLDSTFDKDGIQTTDFRSYDDAINAIVIQSDGKIVAAGYASNGNNYGFAIARYNTNGSLDNTFDADGKRLTYITSNNIFAASVAVAGNGQLVEAGYEQAPADTHTALMRYNSNGSLDNTFDQNGSLIDYFLLKNTVLIKTAVQKDGKTAAAGYYWNGTGNTYFVARYNTDGSLDKTFSADGIQPTNFPLSDIKIQPDGKMVATGSVFNGKNNDFEIVRYNSNGSLDNTFSGDGKEITDFGFDDNANSLAIQADGKIVVAGSSNNKFALARYNSNGSLDKSFSGDGKQTSEFPNSNGSAANSVAVQNNGKIVAAGNMDYDYDYAFAIARYNSNGSLDNTFSGDGMQTTSASDFNIYDEGDGTVLVANSLLVQTDGKIIVAGSGGSYGRDYTFTNLYLARYNTDGSFDNTFGGGGRTAIAFQFSSRDASIALQANGKILVKGNFYGEEEIDYRNYNELPLGYGIARLNTDGNTDPTFGINGILYPHYDQDVQIQDIAIANNKLYAAGYSNDVSSSGFLTRFLLTAPFVKITSPANNTVFAAPATFTIAATASDEDGTVASVTFYKDSTYLKSDSAAPYTCTISDLAAGTYTLTARATDNTGIESSSQPVVISVLPASENKAPVVSITSPSPDAVYKAPATITLQASATDADGTVSAVKFYRGGTLLGTDSTSPYTYKLNNLSAGRYTFTAKAIDNKGLASSSSSVSVAVSVTPNKAPVVTITNPPGNVVYTAPATINITAAASDPDGTINEVDIYNGNDIVGAYSATASGTYEITLTDLAPGNYVFVAKATDNLGLRSSSATTVVQVKAADQAPTVRAASPAGNATNAVIVSSRPYSKTEKTASKDALSLRLAPNPTTNSINISTGGLQQNRPATLSIISLSGNVLKNIQISSTATQLNVSSLASGVYTIKIISGEKVKYKQFVKL